MVSRRDDEIRRSSRNFGGAIDAADIIGLASAADRLGYESAWVSDHILTPEVFESKYLIQERFSRRKRRRRYRSP